MHVNLMFRFCFIILQSSFFAHFMCFEVPALAPPGGAGSDKRPNNDDGNDDDDLGIMDIDETDKKTGNVKLCGICQAYTTSSHHRVYGSESHKLFDSAGKTSPDLTALNESLQDLLDGIQVRVP